MSNEFSVRPDVRKGVMMALSSEKRMSIKQIREAVSESCDQNMTDPEIYLCLLALEQKKLVTFEISISPENIGEERFNDVRTRRYNLTNSGREELREIQAVADPRKPVAGHKVNLLKFEHGRR